MNRCDIRSTNPATLGMPPTLRTIDAPRSGNSTVVAVERETGSRIDCETGSRIDLWFCSQLNLKSPIASPRIASPRNEPPRNKPPQIDSPRYQAKQMTQRRSASSTLVTLAAFPLRMSLLTVIALLAATSVPVPFAGWAQTSVAADQPAPPFTTVLRADFDEPGIGQLPDPQPWPARREAGPRPPMYPGFPAENQAARFERASEVPVVADGGARADLRFTQGDSITLETWVRVDALAPNAFAYLVGKGRNGKPGFPEKNQNYALRLKGDASGAKLSFLFASEGQWHRWTSKDGLAADHPWHHVAVTYTFGKPDSLRAVMDGKECSGVWDMDGKTDRPPVSDPDDLHLGSGNGGGAANRFVGALDALAIHRGVVPLETLKSRFRFLPPPPSVDPATLPVGRVVVELCEQGIASSLSWPAMPPLASERFEIPAFGLAELPPKYVETGIRGDRANPLLLRLAAKVQLPAGKHRWLLRARGLTRLYVDGSQVLSLAAIKGDSGGHGTVARVEDYLNLGPDFRFTPPGTQESWKELSIEGGEHVVIVETMIGGTLGGAKLRPEPGETVVAVALEGRNDWRLLAARAASDLADIPQGEANSLGPHYTDAGWEAYAAEMSREFGRRAAATRAALRASQDDFWKVRRQAAQEWLQQVPGPAVPPLPAGYPAHNPIDHFLAARLETVKSQQTSEPGRAAFHRDIQPLFESVCWDCHRGGKAQGGLRLDSLASARAGGDSGEPAVTPGKSDHSELLRRLRSTDPATRMPPRGEPLSADQIALLERWIAEGANWPELPPEPFALTPVCDDLTFLRRATLDTVGVLPTLDEIAAFTADSRPDKRRHAIDRLLADPRGADHAMGYWLDVLAENPNILNPTLNNTGPFRWWLYESLLDDKPLDLLATELIRMGGSERFGGPAGFAVASQNDVPMAAKAAILATAFLGREMKCARCHDAPAHLSRQEDLFQLGAMLAAQPLEVPATSSVALDKLAEGGRKPLIQVTLKPGAKVPPAWPFADLCDPQAIAATAPTASAVAQSRERLAALITSPANERFAQVMANRIWQRLMGRGIVEPVEDWEKGQPTHPELLRWLGRELVSSGYQAKQLMRLILNSHAYQRQSDPARVASSPLAVAPARRRLAAEQVVDSLFAATGTPFRVEEVSLDIDGRRDLKNSISLGVPRRSWMLASTSNERDRPSLALPRVQAVVDLLQAFGWRPTRQDPASHRETAPNALQPAILANGIAGSWLVRLSDQHGMTRMALEEIPVETLVERLFLALLTRPPTAEERQRCEEHLRFGYNDRRVVAPAPGVTGASGEQPAISQRRPVPYVSWSNHLDPSATIVRQQQEDAARRGDPPTDRLVPEWRERLEDVLWSLVNSPELVFTR